MPRIRAVKPEFWSSPNLPDDPWARLLYIAMWNWADDNGVGTAGIRELLGFAFPNDDHLSPADMRRMLGGIRRDFGVVFYTVAGRPYYAIPSWREHQKFDNRSKGKYPGPELAETQLYQDKDADTADSRRDPPQSRRTPGAGTGEQGNRGTGEALAPLAPRAPASDAEFADGTPIPPEPDDDRAELVLVTDDAPVVEIASRAPKVHVGSSVQTLVRQHVPAGIPKDVQRKVAEQAQRLANDPNVDRRDLEAALVEWARRSDAGPGLLPHLVADAARARQGGKAGAARPEHKTRTLARLIAEEESNDQKGIS